MKKQLLTFFIVLSVLMGHAQTDPCNNIITINCSDTITFSSNGVGDSTYDNNVPCNGPNGIGGQEQIYQFTAPATGYYQLEVITVANGNVVSYGWKDLVSGCNANSWNCIDRIGTPPRHIGAINLIAGQTIYIIANAESPNATTQQFILHCAINVCNNIQTINCDSVTQFSSLGYGDATYDNNVPCDGPNGQGGQEQIYQFTAPATGYYQLEVITVANGNVVSYGWKDPVSGCNANSWNCIDRIGTPPRHIGAINLTIGQTIYIIANAESPNATTQQFILHCAINVCNNIQTINCDSVTQFSSLGYGDATYDNNVPCDGPNGQGGQEQIYQFTAPATGYYQLEVITVANGNVVSYGWKDPISGCNANSWNCTDRIGTPPRHIGAINLIAGQTIYIIANAESPNATTQQFIIHCGINNCANIIDKSCGSVVQFDPLGFGDVSIDNNVPCNGPNGQGGQEQIYRLPASTSNYQIVIAAVSGGIISFGWKYDTLGCSSNGWACIGRTGTPATYTISNTDSCQRVLLIVNSEIPVQVNTTFTINCSLSPCNPTGIRDSDLMPLLSVYPNPVNESLKIELYGPYHHSTTISILDVCEKKIHKLNVINQSKVSIDVSELQCGVYFVQVETEKGLITKKFIKQ